MLKAIDLAPSKQSSVVLHLSAYKMCAEIGVYRSYISTTHIAIIAPPTRPFPSGLKNGVSLLGTRRNYFGSLDLSNCSTE